MGTPWRLRYKDAHDVTGPTRIRKKNKQNDSRIGKTTNRRKRQPLQNCQHPPQANENSRGLTGIG